MAKTTAPLLSFGAKGQIASTAVYATWRGIPYVRRHVIPANPKTTAQTLTRTTFATLREFYKVLPQLGRDPWDAFARGRPFTGMNAMVGENLRVLRGEADMAKLLGSPGANGGLSIDSVTVAAGTGTGEIDVTVTPGTIPANWTLSKVAAVATPDQDPSAVLDGPVVTAEATADPWTITLSGFASAELVVASAWAVWTKPDGKTAYSVAKTGSANAGA